MQGLCNAVSGLAGLFLLLALLVAVVETALALWAKWKALQRAPQLQAAPDPDKLAKLLEALTKLLLALKDLPAWIAIFLAGLALVWTASSAPHLCA